MEKYSDNFAAPLTACLVFEKMRTDGLTPALVKVDREKCEAQLAGMPAPADLDVVEACVALIDQCNIYTKDQDDQDALISLIKGQVQHWPNSIPKSDLERT